jgi:murein peptide amidase A
MSTLLNCPASETAATAPRRSIAQLLAVFERLSSASAGLIRRPIGSFEHGSVTYEMPRYVHLGYNGGDGAIRIGVFAGLHGNEPEGSQALAQFAQLLTTTPEIAEGYSIFFYPLCNPTGFEDNTRLTRGGTDLNRESWRNSHQPEVQLLEKEILWQSFEGIISLHSDRNSSGLYAFAQGATLTKLLLRPALKAAAELLPLNQASLIDAFEAKDGLINGAYDGALSAPPTIRPKPFEICLETPGQTPAFVQHCASVLALREILCEYREFIAYGANL